MATLSALQRWIYTAITSELGGFAASGSVGTFVSVLPLGILFGALHALTPSHSKAILASVIVGSAVGEGNRNSLSAGGHARWFGCHRCPGPNLLIARTIGGAGRAPPLEHIRRALLVMVGVWMIFRALCKPHGHDIRGMTTAGFIAGCRVH